MKKVQNLHFLCKLLKNPLPKKVLFAIKAIMITIPNSAKVVMQVTHNQVLQVWCNPKTHTNCLDTDAVAICALHSFTAMALCPNRPHECNFFVGRCWIPYLGWIKLVVSWEATLPFFRYPSYAMDSIDDQISTKYCGIVTSRKLYKKNLQSFSHCGSFDHHDLQSLNYCKFLFFVLQLHFFAF